jgi:hypothetical protein
MYSTGSSSTEAQAHAAHEPNASVTGSHGIAWVTVLVSISLLGALVWGLNPRQPRLSPAPLDPVPPGCQKLVRAFLPTNITEIPQWLSAHGKESSPASARAAFQKLNDREKESALLHLNVGPCTCGCNLSVASCMVNEPVCSASRDLAQKVIARAKH